MDVSCWGGQREDRGGTAGHGSPGGVGDKQPGWAPSSATSPEREVCGAGPGTNGIGPLRIGPQNGAPRLLFIFRRNL